MDRRDRSGHCAAHLPGDRRHIWPLQCTRSMSQTHPTCSERSQHPRRRTRGRHQGGDRGDAPRHRGRDLTTTRGGSHTERDSGFGIQNVVCSLATRTHYITHGAPAILVAPRLEDTGHRPRAGNGTSSARRRHPPARAVPLVLARCPPEWTGSGTPFPRHHTVLSTRIPSNPHPPRPAHGPVGRATLQMTHGPPGGDCCKVGASTGDRRRSG